MSKHIITALPTDAVALLAGRSDARAIAENIHAAYWLHGRDSSSALHLMQMVHDDFAGLAAALGYTIARKPEPKVGIAELKAAWAEVCNAMADGYWRGTEAEALAEIERIKAEIAQLEAAS